METTDAERIEELTAALRAARDEAARIWNARGKPDDMNHLLALCNDTLYKNRDGTDDRD